MGHSTAAIWSELSTDLGRFIRRRVSDEHVADDLLQETFLRIHRSMDSLTDADRLAAWVYQIARNVIHDHFRKSMGSAVALADLEFPDERDDGVACLRRRTGQWLDELIRQLPDHYRQAVQMSEIEGLTQQEVADGLGLSLSGAKSRIQRGRAMLRQSLDQCCWFEFDRRGNLMDYEPKPQRTICRNCDDVGDARC
jgi:RNA polymerase sigma-70 factor (ECF subfamily)